MFDYSNPHARASFAARYDSLSRNDPLHKIVDLEHDVVQLSKVVAAQRATLARLSGNDSAAAHRNAEILVKAATEHAALEQRVATGLFRKAQGRQPPYVFGPSTAQQWQDNYAAFRDRWRSH